MGELNMNKIALLFPGQGSQYVGMGKELCKKYTVANEVFEEANEVLGFDLKKLCFEGDLQELTKTENTQPAILTTSVAMFKVYMQEFGFEPRYLAGHSLGEYSALTCSGVISFSDAIKIVRNRGKFMQESAALGTGAMAAVSGIDKEIIEKECEEISSENNIVVISNYNSPDQIVISGHCDAVSKLSERFKDIGANVVPLNVSAPFHSPLMKAAAEKLREELLKYNYGSFKWPVVSNVEAIPYQGNEKIVENLTIHMTKAVKWQQSIEYMKSNGIDMFIELGPKTVLKGLMRKNAPGVAAFSYDKEEDIEKLRDLLLSKKSVSEVESSSKKKEFKHTVLTKCLAIAVCTRNRNWNNEEYQKGVVEPYRKIQQMQLELENQGKEPSYEQMLEALEMLKSVFITKKVPYEEQVERFNEVFDETNTRGLFPDFKF